MIHIATTHYGTERWIDLQLRHLGRHTPEPYRVYACLSRVGQPYLSRLHFAVEGKGRLGQNLNFLAGVIGEQAREDDLLVFLDGDAFPIDAWVGPARGFLADSPLAAVRRDENAGDPQPHQCFCVTTPRFWKEIGGDWSPGPTWTTAAGQSATDHGAKLWKILEERGVAWQPILRSNTRNLHPLWFGIYGKVVYHHGAGFRAPMSRLDGAQAMHLPPPLRPFARKRREIANRRLSKSVYCRLSKDEGFFRELLA
jgi:hypothetical protein